MASQALVSSPAEALSGTCLVPGDKSISHRSLMLGSLAVGRTEIQGLLEGEDVLMTAAAMRALGAHAERREDGSWLVEGRGVGGLAEPADVLDLGNAGTGARLLLGLLASHPLTAVMTGDRSLRSRPMARVAAPLTQMGAKFVGRDGCRLPLAITGARDPLPISYKLPVASAQVKSAILLAGLNTPGETSVTEPEPTRDHTELMLRHFGVSVQVEMTDQGRRSTVIGQPEITGRTIRVPADPSSAAFPMVAAAMLPGSDVTLSHVGINPHRIGLIETLREMGADITLLDRREDAGEPVADLRIRGGRLSGVEVPAARAPSMIDEYPVLSVAAALAKGRTVMRGLGELRVKESDRLAAMANGLRSCGIQVEDGPDYLVVHGGAGRPRGDAVIAANLDHRIAMAFLVLGMVAEKPVGVDDGSPIETSFPGFATLMNGLGARIGPAVG